MGNLFGLRERARGRTQPRSRLVYERARRVSTREPRTRRLEDAESSRPSLPIKARMLTLSKQGC